MMAKPVRGIYVARLNLGAPHLAGVGSKIRAQMHALSGLPAELDLFSLDEGRVVLGARTVRDCGATRWGRRVAHYLGFHLALAGLRGYAFAYIRHQGTSPLALWALWRLRRNNPGIRIVLEIPTYPYDGENRGLRQRLLLLIDRASRGALHRFVDRVVTFSRQTVIFGIPAISTDNGVDLESIAPLTPPPVATLELLGLANLSFWHGYDRVIAGLARYLRGAPARPVRFHVIGEGSELPHLREQALAAGLQAEVVFHGAQRGAALEALLKQAHVGISTLAMHRIRTDTSNIKSREFCARGLPFVIGYADRDFGNDLPFVFHAPASEEPLDMAAVVDWFDGLREQVPEYPRTMRAYAEARLGWDTKLRPVLDYLAGVAEVVHA